MLCDIIKKIKNVKGRTAVKAVKLDIYAKFREEIKDLKKQIEELKRLNSELEQKVRDIYGAYETLQYTFRGRCQVYSSEIVKLRQEIEGLKTELRARGWEER